jgi:hypothetical protein
MYQSRSSHAHGEAIERGENPLYAIKTYKHPLLAIINYAIPSEPSI